MLGVEDSGTLIGHNILDFDLKAAARHYGLDYDALSEKAIDTLVLSRLTWPVEVTKPGVQPEHGHGLDELAKRFLGLDGKAPLGETASGRARTLATYAATWNRRAKVGDKYRAIPTDDQPYRDYCAQDVDLLVPLYEAILGHEHYDEGYALREMRYVRSLQRSSWRGFRVDVDMANERDAAEAARITTAKQWFNDHGIEVKKKMSDPGKQAFGKMLEGAGFNVPKTPTGRAPASDDALVEAGVDHESMEYLRMLNTARGLPHQTLTVMSYYDRVHPSIQTSQASGRLSTTKLG